MPSNTSTRCGPLQEELAANGIQNGVDLSNATRTMVATVATKTVAIYKKRSPR